MTQHLSEADVRGIAEYTRIGLDAEEVVAMTADLNAIIDSQSGRVLGCTLFCADSSEVINIVNMAMKTGQIYTFLRDFIFTHPSMGEGLNELFSID